MIAVYCKDCRRRMLLPLTDVEGIHETAEGFMVAFRCIHDHHGTWPLRRRTVQP